MNGSDCHSKCARHWGALRGTRCRRQTARAAWRVQTSAQASRSTAGSPLGVTSLQHFRNRLQALAVSKPAMKSWMPQPLPSVAPWFQPVSCQREGRDPQGELGSVSGTKSSERVRGGEPEGVRKHLLSKKVFCFKKVFRRKKGSGGNKRD